MIGKWKGYMKKEAHYFCLNLVVSSFALFCTTQDLLTSLDILPKTRLTYITLRLMIIQCWNPPIFEMRLDCNNRIFRSLHQFCRWSIFSISSWCRDSSSSVDMTHSLCSLLLRTNSSDTVIYNEMVKTSLMFVPNLN